MAKFISNHCLGFFEYYKIVVRDKKIWNEKSRFMAFVVPAVLFLGNQDITPLERIILCH